MGDETPHRSLLRRLVGQPPLWQGIFWTALGLTWAGIASADPTPVWRWVIAGIWLAFGISALIVSISDYRHRRGRYTNR